MPVFAAIISFLLALLVLPLIRARNEKKRLTSLKQAVILWLEFVSSKLSYQIQLLEEFIKILKEDKHSQDYTFRVVDIQIDHLLSYNDEDLRKILFEKLNGNASPKLYVEIMNDLRFVKANQKHLEETYDKWAISQNKKQFHSVFEISLEELQDAKDAIDEYLSDHKNSSIKGEWWIWT